MEGSLSYDEGVSNRPPVRSSKGYHEPTPTGYTPGQEKHFPDPHPPGPGPPLLRLLLPPGPPRPKNLGRRLCLGPGRLVPSLFIPRRGKVRKSPVPIHRILDGFRVPVPRALLFRPLGNEPSHPDIPHFFYFRLEPVRGPQPFRRHRGGGPLCLPGL